MSRDKNDKGIPRNLKSLANRKYSWRSVDTRKAASSMFRGPSSGSVKKALIQGNAQKRAGHISPRTDSYFISLTKNNAADADCRTRLTEQVTEAVQRKDWTGLCQQLERNQDLAEGLPPGTIQKWVELSERSGRYDVTECLIEFLSPAQRAQDWYRQTEQRTRYMNLTPSRLPPSLRNPALSVIDAVRDNDFSTLGDILSKEVDKNEDLIDLAEKVNSTLHFVWSKAKHQKYLRIGDVEKSSSLSRPHLLYLLRSWIDE